MHAQTWHGGRPTVRFTGTHATVLCPFGHQYGRVPLEAWPASPLARQVADPDFWIQCVAQPPAAA